ncbi:MAG: hypothetical protein ABEK50_01610 [bacterium]
MTSESPDDLSGNANRRRSLIEASLEYLLTRPLEDFVDLNRHINTALMADYITRIYRQFVRREEARRLMSEGINTALASTDTLDGTLGEFMPDELTDHLKDLVGREYRANRELIGSMIRHSSLRIVIRNVMQDILREFVDRTSQWIEESGTIPGMQGVWNLFLSAFGVARSFTKRFSEEYERRIEKRIELFVDDVLFGMFDGEPSKLKRRSNNLADGFYAATLRLQRDHYQNEDDE